MDERDHHCREAVGKVAVPALDSGGVAGLVAEIPCRT
jgi:hypothetical protein